jgi:ribosome maturation factor RimP
MHQGIVLSRNFPESRFADLLRRRSEAANHFFGLRFNACMRFRIFTAASHLETILRPVVEAAGFDLVRLRIMGAKSKTVQIMAERADGTMNVEDCATLSRALSAFLEAEDPIEGEYDLEVSSPGIDRPLTRAGDFARWAGHEAKVELHAPLEGRKRFRGIIALEGNDVTVQSQSTLARFPFAAIAEAKLVLTDKLISENLRGHRNVPKTEK